MDVQIRNIQDYLDTVTGIQEQVVSVETQIIGLVNTITALQTQLSLVELDLDNHKAQVVGLAHPS